MARLTVFYDGNRVAHYDIKSGEIRVGRHPDSEIFLPDAAVSRHQMTFETYKDGWMVKPAGRNTTLINSQPLGQATILLEGTLLEFGRYLISYSEEYDSTRTEEVDAVTGAAALKAIGPVPVPTGGEAHEGTSIITAAMMEEQHARTTELVRPHFVWRTSDGKEHTHSIPQSGMYIGKGAGCQIKVAGGMMVADQHARVVKGPKGFVIAPCGFMAKVLVNNGKVKKMKDLQNGDQVQIGDTVLVFRTSITANR